MAVIVYKYYRMKDSFGKISCHVLYFVCTRSHAGLNNCASHFCTLKYRWIFCRKNCVMFPLFLEAISHDPLIIKDLTYMFAICGKSSQPFEPRWCCWMSTKRRDPTCQSCQWFSQSLEMSYMSDYVHYAFSISLNHRLSPFSGKSF